MPSERPVTGSCGVRSVVSGAPMSRWAYIQWDGIICRSMRWEYIRIVPMPSLLVKFGKTVRKLREEAGYSQESFAAAVGVHRTYMGTIERGRGNPTLDMIAKIARGLGMSVARLLDKVEGG